MNCGNPTQVRKYSGIFQRRKLAFTLIEMLLVITIIALLAAVGLPHLKGWGESNSMTSATRQIMDDLSLARLKAINSRSTVYMVFISPDVVDPAFLNRLTTEQRKQANNLFNGQYTTYAIFTRRQVGEQPGRDNPKYLTEWKSLPEKVFIATNKFRVTSENIRFSNYTETNRPFATNAFPFPTANDTNLVELPCLAFNSRGQLVSEGDPSQPGRYEGATIPLARGSIFYARDTDGALIVGPADPVETPPQNSLTNYNNIRIDWLTGRVRVERREFQ